MRAVGKSCRMELVITGRKVDRAGGMASRVVDVVPIVAGKDRLLPVERDACAGNCGEEPGRGTGAVAGAFRSAVLCAAEFAC